MNMLTVEKTKMNQKEAWNGLFKKTTSQVVV